MDELTVSGGGVGRVSTETMTVHAAALRSFEQRIEDARWRIFTVQALSSLLVLGPQKSPAVFAAASHLSAAHFTLGLAYTKSGMLANALDHAAETYGLTERANEAVLKQLFGGAAYVLGQLYPVVVGWFLPAINGTILGWKLSSETGREKVLEALAEQKSALSDPRVVELIRYSVMSVDEFGAGLARIPPQLMPLLGDEALGVLGYTGTVATVGALGRVAGVMVETPVSVTRTSMASAPPAEGIAESVERIPIGSDQVRIDRISVPGEPDRFAIYISGTRDGTIGETIEPFDMTSNITALGMGDAGSIRAVEQMMREAGITAENPVQIVGHSQGGLVATQVANNPEWNVQTVVTVGAPTGQIPVRDGVQTLAIEHTDDLIPALAGTRVDHDTVVASRRLFADGAVPDTSVLPAHELTRYQETAALVDASVDERVTKIADGVADFTAGATTVESSLWRAERVTAEAPPEPPAVCAPYIKD